MRSRRHTRVRVKFLAVIFVGCMFSQLLSNCTSFWNQEALIALNSTWFLTCDTDTLFSGNGILIDCQNVDTSSSSSTSDSSSTSSGLGGLLGF